MTNKKALHSLQSQFYKPGGELFLASKKHLINKYQGRLSNNDISKWLNRQDVVQLFRSDSKPSSRWRNVVYSYKPRMLVSMDLLDYSKSPSQNHRYILGILDTMTRFLWTYPQKSKTAKETLTNFRKWLKNLPLRKFLRRLSFDLGGEFAEIK